MPAKRKPVPKPSDPSMLRGRLTALTSFIATNDVMRMSIREARRSFVLDGPHAGAWSHTLGTTTPIPDIDQTRDDHWTAESTRIGDDVRNCYSEISSALERLKDIETRMLRDQLTGGHQS